MAKGQISDTNTTMSFVIPRDLKDELGKIAAKENRSMSNLGVNLIDNYVHMNQHQDRLKKYYELVYGINKNNTD